MAQVKTLLTRVLTPEAGPILIDPNWTHPHALPYIPGSVGSRMTETEREEQREVEDYANDDRTRHQASPPARAP